MAALISKPGINSSTAGGNAVPAAWSQSWFRGFISDYLKGADVRNAIAGPGITITGNITSPYATISAGGAGAPFTGPVIINQGAHNVPALTINSTNSTFTDVAELIKLSNTGTIFGLEISNIAGGAAGISLAGNGNAIDSTDFELYQTSSGTAVIANEAAAAMQLYTSGNLRLSITSGGNVTVATPDSGVALTVNGLVNQNAQVLFAPNTNNQSFGLVITAGTTSSDYSLYVRNAASGVFFFQVRGDGAIGFHGAGPVLQTTGFGTPVGAAVVANYNITDAGGANSNTNKCVAEILTVLKGLGLIGA